MSPHVVRRAPRPFATLSRSIARATLAFASLLAVASCRDATAADAVTAELSFPVPATQGERLAWPVTPSIQPGSVAGTIVVRATARFGCGIPEAVATRIGSRIDVIARVRPGTETMPCAASLVVLDQLVRVEIGGLDLVRYTVSARVAGHDGAATFEVTPVGP